MKQLIIFCLFIFSTQLNAQELTENYKAVQFGYAAKTITGNAGIYSFDLIGTSNTISASSQIFEQYEYNTFDISFNFGKYRGLNHKLFFNVPNGDTGSGKFGYGIGYNFVIPLGQSNVIINPGILISTGGTTDNSILHSVPDVFQIEDVTFMNNYSISYSGNASFITPKLEATFLIKQKVGIRLEIGYDYAFSESQSITIQSDIEDDDTKIDIDYPSDNISSITSSNPAFEWPLLKYSTPSALIGISYYWNHDVY